MNFDDDRFEEDLDALVRALDPLGAAQLESSQQAPGTAWPGLVPAFGHIRDAGRYWNGSDGDWTVCGQPWRRPDRGLPLPECPECARLWNQVYGSGS